MLLVGKSAPLSLDRSIRSNRSNNSSKGSDYNLILDHNGLDSGESSSSLNVSLAELSVVSKSNPSPSKSAEKYSPNASGGVKAMNKSDLDKSYDKHRLHVGSSERFITDSLTSADTLDDRADGTIISSPATMMFNDSQTFEASATSIHSASIESVFPFVDARSSKKKSSHSHGRKNLDRRGSNR